MFAPRYVLCYIDEMTHGYCNFGSTCSSISISILRMLLVYFAQITVTPVLLCLSEITSVLDHLAREHTVLVIEHLNALIEC